MLEVAGVHTYYGGSHVLQGVSLEVPKGHIVTVLGRNGVGKTTLVRSIVGFSPPRSGRIVFDGQEITRLPSHRIVRLGLGLVPQGRRIFPSLSVKENLEIAARGSPNPADGGSQYWDLEGVLALFPSLRERISNPAGKLSGGEQQMLAVGRAIVGNPTFLLMDEPSEGLAPVIVQQFSRIIQRLKAEGLSMLLVEQNLGFALGVADHAYVMNKGRIVYDAAPRDLWGNREVKAQYLGV